MKQQNRDKNAPKDNVNVTKMQWLRKKRKEIQKKQKESDK